LTGRSMWRWLHSQFNPNPLRMASDASPTIIRSTTDQSPVPREKGLVICLRTLARFHFPSWHAPSSRPRGGMWGTWLGSVAREVPWRGEGDCRPAIHVVPPGWNDRPLSRDLSSFHANLRQLNSRQTSAGGVPSSNVGRHTGFPHGIGPIPGAIEECRMQCRHARS